MPLDATAKMKGENGLRERRRRTVNRDERASDPAPKTEDEDALARKRREKQQWRRELEWQIQEKSRLKMEEERRAKEMEARLEKRFREQIKRESLQSPGDSIPIKGRQRNKGASKYRDGMADNGHRTSGIADLLCNITFFYVLLSLLNYWHGVLQLASIDDLFQNV